ncbi:hypothetical protein K0M31_007843 [Melipona bicolor]|uniref:Uncharacterized protein n=1 Tax=Melipona bicolor TaxID=60889 RepID=A0AA40GC64_9HYME|nr:hypothetical protein K0M31_007843 [Melipona bicolor]
MDDHEIQSTVESILGPGVKVVDCEKKSTMREEEVLLINGVPIPLEGPDGVAIREAMITGQVPPCDLLNQILVKAGILRYRRGSSSNWYPHCYRARSRLELTTFSCLTPYC